jgi:mycothiol synthase
MNLPEGYTDRPAALEEVDAYVELFEAWDLADSGRTEPVREHLQADLTSSAIDIERDTRAVYAADGSAAALAQVEAIDPRSAIELYALVHPRHQGRGIGAACLVWMEARAQERIPAGASPPVYSTTSGTDRRGTRLLETKGYRQVRTFVHMEASLGRSPEPARPPAGVEVGPVRLHAEEPEIHRLIEEAFQGSFGWTARSFEHFHHDTFEAATFDPGLMLVARVGDDVVGVVHGMVTEDDGHVSVLAVLERFRGRGIGEALLRRSFDAFVRRGLAHVWLNVDSENDAGAVGLYERVGMTPRRRWVVFERRLDGG